MRFLEPPPRAKQPTAAVPASPQPYEAVTPAPESAWPEPVGANADEVRVAAALVHGTPEDVRVAAQALPREQALLLESFAWAVAGEGDQASSSWPASRGTPWPIRSAGCSRRR